MLSSSSLLLLSSPRAGGGSGERNASPQARRRSNVASHLSYSSSAMSLLWVFPEAFKSLFHGFSWKPVQRRFVLWGQFILPSQTFHHPVSLKHWAQEDLDLPSWPPILAEGMKPGPCTCLDTSAPIPSTPPGTRSVREPNPANCCFPTDGCTEVPEVARVLLTQCWKQYKVQMDVMSSSTVQNFDVADENLWCFIPVNCICIMGHCALWISKTS